MRWIPRGSLLALACALSCANPADRPPPVGMTLRLANLAWTDIDGPLHLRIFDRGALQCDATRGVVTDAAGVPSNLANIPGRLVLPNERCEGTAWATRLREQNGGEAQPVDLCFMQGTPGPMGGVDVPPGDYIVLIEGPGTGIDPSSGGTLRYRRASGCAVQAVMRGDRRDVSILLQEQALSAAGVCGDMRRDANEQCDEGTGNNRAGGTCNEVCRFPERLANGAMPASGRRRFPAVAWAPMQPMVIGFNDSSDVFVHSFDANGRPGATTSDLTLDLTRSDEQTGIALAAGPAGYAAAWTTFERSPNADIEATLFGGFELPQPPMASVFVNATSTGPAGTRSSAGIAISEGRAGHVFMDNLAGAVRISATGASPPLTAPMRDGPVTSGMGATGAAGPRIVAVSGGFVVAWSANQDIFAARTDSMGTMAAAVQVNTDPASAQTEPALAANGGTVAIAWRDARSDAIDSSGSTIRVRMFNEMLAPSSADVTVPTTVTGDQNTPTVAVSNAGRVLVAWQHNDGHIRGRFFGNDGAARFNAFNVTTGDFQLSAGTDETDRGAGPRATPAAAFGGANLFVVAWEDTAGGGATSEIRMRVLNAPQ